MSKESAVATKVKRNGNQAVTAFCSDGWVHGFYVLSDDQHESSPMCDASAVMQREPDDHDPMCLTCIPLVATVLDLDPNDFADMTTREWH